MGFDEEYNDFDLGEEIFANNKQFLATSIDDWNAIKNSRIEKQDKFQKSDKSKNKNYKSRNKNNKKTNLKKKKLLINSFNLKY